MTIRLIIFLLVGFFLLGNAPLRNDNTTTLAEPKQVEVQIPFPYLGKSFKDCHDSSLFVKLYIINHTDTVASFYEDWNSWGYFNIAFQIRTNKGLDTIVKKVRSWPKNFASYVSLFPGDSLQLNFNLPSLCLCHGSYLNNCQNSPFSGTVPKPKRGLKSITAIYQLDSNVHKQNDRFGADSIKYKYARYYSTNQFIRRRHQERIIVDSLKKAIEAKRTFPLVKLESKEYKF